MNEIEWDWLNRMISNQNKEIECMWGEVADITYRDRSWSPGWWFGSFEVFDDLTKQKIGALAKWTRGCRGAKSWTYHSVQLQSYIENHATIVYSHCQFSHFLKYELDAPGWVYCSKTLEHFPNISMIIWKYTFLKEPANEHLVLLFPQALFVTLCAAAITTSS